MSEYDVAVLGAGPGGYVAAIRASQLGLSACVIEKDKPGGVCLNIGCIPSKALIHQAEIFHSIKGLEDMGVKVDSAGLDYEKVFQKSRKAADKLSKGVQFLLKKNKVDLKMGTGKLKGPKEIELDNGETVRAKNIIVATGSRPRELPPFPFDEEKILSSTGALFIKELPKSMVILGAGAIGCEFAHVMSTFGVKVTLVEMLPTILPTEDPELSAVLERALKKKGVEVLTKSKASAAKVGKSGVKVDVELPDGSSKTVSADKFLVVVGRVPNTQEIGLEAVGIKPDQKGFIPVGDYYQTNIPGIYAIGDVVDSPLLAHVASKEGEIAVEHMAGHKPEPKVPWDQIPGAVYTEPGIASFGLRENEAKEKGIEYEKATFPYSGAGKTVAVEASEGMVKVLLDPKTKEILGAHIVGKDATELIHELLLAKHAELLPEDIAQMIHAHPTVSEAVMESMRAAEGWAIHI